MRSLLKWAAVAVAAWTLLLVTVGSSVWLVAAVNGSWLMVAGCVFVQWNLLYLVAALIARERR